jgi:succinoglycan biosynthesis transport protein ExoP
MDTLKNAPQETKLHFLDYWRIIRIRKTVILAVFLLVVITATVVTMMYPESYASTATIKVEQDRPDVGLDNPQVNGYDIFFLETESKMIQSDAVLSKVIEAMGLNEAWSKKYGRPFKTSEIEEILKHRISVNPDRNTKLFNITARSDNAEEAAKLANQVVASYKQFRLDQFDEINNRGIKSLQEQVTAQEQKIKVAQDEVDKLRSDLKIPDSMANSEGTPSSITAESLQHLNSMRIEKEADYDKQQKLLEKLKSMERGELKKALPVAVQDSQLNELLSQLNLAEQNLIKLEKDYQPDHPTYQNAKKSVDDLNRKINDRIDGILVGLQTQVDSAKAYVDSLRDQVGNATKTDIESAAKSAPYFAAKRNLEDLQKFRQVLLLKVAQETVEGRMPKNTMVTVATPAIVDRTPVSPNKPLDIGLGVVFGLVVGIGLAFFIEYLDTSVKTIDDVERTLQSPVLGVIPQNMGLILEEGAESPHAEAYRVLRTNIMFSRKDDKLNTIVVVSAGAGEGKSTTAFNLATIFAQNGSRVLVVDSDLRRPTLHKMVNVTNSIGLTNYLLKQNSLDEVIQTTKVPTLHLMASGKLPSSSLGILSSSQMKDLISELKQRYDFVFFDSPPIMGVSDASILASEVDMTLQVIQYRRYPQPMNVRAKQMIEKVGGNLVGIVLNNINMSQDESYYYYSGYYHDYYYSKNNDKAEAAPRGNAPAATGERAKLDIKPKY